MCSLWEICDLVSDSPKHGQCCLSGKLGPSVSWGEVIFLPIPLPLAIGHEQKLQNLKVNEIKQP